MDIWISWNASGMNVTVAIFEEKPFDVAGLVEEDGMQSSIASDAQANKGVRFVDVHLEDVIHIYKNRINVKPT